MGRPAAKSNDASRNISGKSHIVAEYQVMISEKEVVMAKNATAITAAASLFHSFQTTKNKSVQHVKNSGIADHARNVRK